MIGLGEMSPARIENAHRGAAMRIGVIGCGDISAAYLRTLAGAAEVQVVAVADRNIERASSRAEEFAIPWHGAPHELLALRDVELVLNLTTPASHHSVSADILRSAKHLWSEKPIALTSAHARHLLELAETNGVSIACAPDTPLAPGIQAAMRALRDGVIGRPVSVRTVAASRGPDLWHPRPEFLFGPSGGPVLDIGPYYLAVMLLMFGDVEHLIARGRRRHEVRTIGSGDRAGEVFAVEALTEVSAEIHFALGVTATSLFSFDADADGEEQLCEVTGTAGVLSVPIDGSQAAARVRGLATDSSWSELCDAGDHGPLERGTGVVEQVQAVRAGREPLLSAALAARVLDVLEGILRSAETGEPVELRATREQFGGKP